MGWEMEVREGRCVAGRGTGRARMQPGCPFQLTGVEGFSTPILPVFPPDSSFHEMNAGFALLAGAGVFPEAPRLLARRTSPYRACSPAVGSRGGGGRPQRPSDSRRRLRRRIVVKAGQPRKNRAVFARMRWRLRQSLCPKSSPGLMDRAKLARSSTTCSRSRRSMHSTTECM